MKRKVFFYLKLCLSFVMLFFSFFTLIFLCYAWFSSNTFVSSNSIDASIIKSNIAKDINFYSVKESNYTNDGILVNIDSLIDSNNIKMPSYDFTSSSKEILMEVELYETQTLSKFVGLSEASYLGNDILKMENNGLSSIVSFYVEYDLNLKEEILFSNDHYSSFVSFNSSNPTFSNRIDLYVSEEIVSKVYVLFTYHIESLNYIYSKNIGNNILNECEELAYKSDIIFYLVKQ